MDFLRPELIPDPTVRRLSLYLRQLEAFQRQERVTVSSRQLADALNLTDAQVRKDLTYFGNFGQPGVGYNITDLVGRIRRILGTDRQWSVLLVGAGNLGRALLSYGGFAAKGLAIVAVFDSDPAKVGQTIAGRTVQAMESLADNVTQHDARLAILAVPADFAQPVADQLIAAGIRGILNFSPTSLHVPATVAVQTVDLALHLEQLTFLVSLNYMTRAGARHL